jgi:hypothetical protein
MGNTLLKHVSSNQERTSPHVVGMDAQQHRGAPVRQIADTHGGFYPYFRNP